MVQVVSLVFSLLLDTTVVVTVSLLLAAQCSPQDKTKTDVMRLRKVGILSLSDPHDLMTPSAGQAANSNLAHLHYSGQTTARGPCEAFRFLETTLEEMAEIEFHGLSLKGSGWFGANLGGSRWVWAGPKSSEGVLRWS